MNNKQVTTKNIKTQNKKFKQKNKEVNKKNFKRQNKKFKKKNSIKRLIRRF